MKSITAHGTLSVNRKYLNNIDVKSNALYIQAANFIPAYFDNDEAMSSRLIAHRWTSSSFRNKSSSVIVNDVETTFDLNKLINHDEMFIDCYFTKLFNEVEDFKMFDVPKESLEMSKDILFESDTIGQYLSERLQLIDGYDEIPMKLLLADFKNWSKENSPISYSMKQNTFIKELERHQKTFQFEIIKKPKRFNEKSSEFVSLIRSAYDIGDDSLSNQMQSYIKIHNPITNAEKYSMLELLHNCETINDLSERQIQILRIFIEKHHDSLLMQKFGDTI